jgi:hypothetical protein
METELTEHGRPPKPFAGWPLWVALCLLPLAVGFLIDIIAFVPPVRKGVPGELSFMYFDFFLTQVGFFWLHPWLLWAGIVLVGRRGARSSRRAWGVTLVILSILFCTHLRLAQLARLGAHGGLFW